MTDKITSGSMTFDASAPLTANWGNITLPEPQQYAFYVPLKPVGYWKIGHDGRCGMQFPMFKKPTDEQIKNHLEMLGWEWEDAV